MRQWQKWVWHIFWSGAFILLVPSFALADNCSSLGDCYGTVCGALATGGGIGAMFGGGLGSDSGGGGEDDSDPGDPEGGDEPPAGPC